MVKDNCVVLVLKQVKNHWSDILDKFSESFSWCLETRPDVFLLLINFTISRTRANVEHSKNNYESKHEETRAEQS